MSFKDILDLFRQGKATAKSHMKNLIEMAGIDGRLASEEMSLLQTIAAKNGISPSRLEEIRSNPGNITFEVPKDEHEKFNQLYDLVHMMVVDKDIDPEEVRLSEIFAGKFGYDHATIPGLINTIKGNIENGSDVGKTFERVKYYLSYSDRAV